VFRPGGDHRVPEGFLGAAMALDDGLTPTAGSPAHRTAPGWRPGHPE
jgi:hypothetical protein